MTYKIGEKKDGKIIVEFSLNATEWEAEIQKFTKARFFVPPLRRRVPALPAFSHCRRIGGWSCRLSAGFFAPTGQNALKKQTPLFIMIKD